MNEKEKPKNQQSLDDIAEIIGRIIPIMRKYLCVDDYEAYIDFLEAHESLLARVEKQRNQYQDKAEYYRANTKKWRKDNAERHKAYQDAWKGKPCICEEKDTHNWCVTSLVKRRKPNTPQKYTVECDICGAKWKSTASYCAELRQKLS